MRDLQQYLNKKKFKTYVFIQKSTHKDFAVIKYRQWFPMLRLKRKAIFLRWTGFSLDIQFVCVCLNLTFLYHLTRRIAFFPH